MFLAGVVANWFRCVGGSNSNKALPGLYMAFAQDDGKTSKKATKKEKNLSKKARKRKAEEEKMQEQAFEQQFYREFWPENL